MARAPILHQETRLSPTPASPSQSLRITTAAAQQQTPTFGAGRKRAFDEISGLDEESYARKYLATEGSVFFRRKGKSPRSFLWRVLEERKVVEVQCVDLLHDTRSSKGGSTSGGGSGLTFNLYVPDEIVRNGVAFAEPEESDALECFVLTTGNELYTFSLKRDLLTRETAPSEFDSATVVKKYVSGSFSFRHPYRLVAVTSLEVLISLHDGGLMRLERQPNQSGSQWRETFFSEGGWSGTLRGLISLKRHQTLRYGNIELAPSALAALAKSPDGTFIWTVSLDHELKAWSTATGKADTCMDLLDERYDDDGRKQQKYIMGAEQGTLLQVVSLPPALSKDKRAVARVDEDGTYSLVVHSPKDHQFKFYEVSSTYTSIEGGATKLQDMQPGAQLVPPIDELLNTNIWHLEDFCVLPGPGWEDTQLWVRARSGALCKIFTTTFDLLDGNGEANPYLEASWKTSWTEVDTGMQTPETLRTLSDFPGDLDGTIDTATTPTEKWLSFLFQPGRFSTASIETALNIYRKGRSLPSTASGRGLNSSEAPLQERLAQAISSKILLRRRANETPDYDRYQADVQAQWKTFFSLLSHLHTRRHDSIGFALDAEDGLPWSVCADFVAPIRASAPFDALILNSHLISDEKLLQGVDESIVNQIFSSDESVFSANILAAAHEFRAGLSSSFNAKFAGSAVVEALSPETEDTVESRKKVQALYEQSIFNAEVMDDEFQALTDSAENFDGLGSLDDHAFFGILEHIPTMYGSGKDAAKGLSRWGDRLTMSVAQETLDRDRSTLLDILTLVVFMHGDLDEADLHPGFVDNVGSIFETIVRRIKHNDLLSWLAGHVISEPQRIHHRSLSKSQSEGLSSSQTADMGTAASTVTLLERIAIGDWTPTLLPSGPDTLPELLTQWSKMWVYGADLHSNWDGVTAHTFAFLIKEGSSYALELATDFQKFLSQDEDAPSWLRYLEGRLLMAMGEYAQASLKFQAAAEGVGELRGTANTDTAHLLEVEERNYFGVGQGRFFQHISALFEKLKVFSYTADFASLALEKLESDEESTHGFGSSLRELDMRKSQDSPAINQIDDAEAERRILSQMVQLRDEIKGRLFNALVQTGRFREAFDTLVGIEDMPIKKANLATLVKACVDRDAVPALLEMSFEGAELAQEADTVLLGLAKKALASGSSSATRQPYHQILYAFRTQRSNFRGAAEILYEYLQRLRIEQKMSWMQDPEDEIVLQAYVLLINTLACCGEEDGWLLAEPVDGEGMRKLVRLADVRREYGAELDQRSDVLAGRFPLVGGVGERVEGDVL